MYSKSVMIEFINNHKPIYLASGQTHSVYRVGQFACKVSKYDGSHDIDEYEREIFCLQLLSKNNFPCVTPIGIFDCNEFTHTIFNNKVVFVEEFIKGESLFDNPTQKAADYPMLYEFIERINSITCESFGYVLECCHSSWNDFLSDIKKKICDFLIQIGNLEIYNKIVGLDLTSSYDGKPHFLLMEFNPHNFIFDGTTYKAIDINSLLCGDVIYQWVRLKTHLDLRGRTHYCDCYLKHVDDRLIKKYIILSCGNDIVTRKKLGLDYQKEWNYFKSKVMSCGELNEKI